MDDIEIKLINENYGLYYKGSLVYTFSGNHPGLLDKDKILRKIDWESTKILEKYGYKIVSFFEDGTIEKAFGEIFPLGERVYFVKTRKTSGNLLPWGNKTFFDKIDVRICFKFWDFFVIRIYLRDSRLGDKRRKIGKVIASFVKNIDGILFPRYELENKLKQIEQNMQDIFPFLIPILKMDLIEAS